MYGKQYHLAAVVFVRHGSQSKGLRKTSMKTIMGEVEYQRQVYVDQAATEGTHCAYLLDAALGVEKAGLVSAGACQLSDLPKQAVAPPHPDRRRNKHRICQLMLPGSPNQLKIGH